MSPDATRRRRGRELEQAILAAGWELLQESGYAGFTIESVADRAGTSRPVLYRRWRDRDALVRACLLYGLERTRPSVPDTGSLRTDMIELLRRADQTRATLMPLFSVLFGTYFNQTGTSFADLRAELLEAQPRTGLDQILDRAVARGEVDPARLTDRVRTVAFDLFRHDLLMTGHPVGDETITAIVDEVFLPLAEARSAEKRSGH